MNKSTLVGFALGGFVAGIAYSVAKDLLQFVLECIG